MIGRGLSLAQSIITRGLSSLRIRRLFFWLADTREAQTITNIQYSRPLALETLSAKLVTIDSAYSRSLAIISDIDTLFTVGNPAYNRPLSLFVNSSSLYTVSNPTYGNDLNLNSNIVALSNITDNISRGLDLLPLTTINKELTSNISAE